MPGGMTTNFGLGIMMNARDMASGPIGLLARNFTGLISAVTSGSPLILVGLAAITAAVTLLTLGIKGLSLAWDLAVDAGDFRKNMTAVAGISRATAEEMQLLERSAIDAGIATQFSPEEAASGLQSLAAAGQNATAATETLIPVLDLAAGSLGQLGVAQAAEAVVGTLNSYRMSADQATSVTDRLLRVTQLTNFQARDFEQGLSRAAATAGQYGTSLNDVLINVGLMRNANINASVASTAFREAQTRLMTDTRALQALQRVGVDAYDENTGGARSAIDIMMDLADETRNMTDQQRNTVAAQVFGRRGIIAFNSVLNAQRETMVNGERVTLRGRDAIESLRTEMGNAEGTAADFREKFLETFPGQLQLINGTLQTLGIVFGDVFGVIFKPIVEAVTNVLNFFIKAWTALPKGLQIAIAAIFLVISAVMVLVGGVGLAVIAVVALIVVLGKLLLIALAIFAGIAIAMAPVILAFGALAAGAALVYYAYRENLGGLGDYIRGWVRRIRLVWQGFTQIFTQGFLSGEVAEELGRTENQGLLRFIGSIVDFAHRAEAVWNGVVKAFKRTWFELGPTFKVLVGNLQLIFERVEQVFGDSAGGMIDVLGRAPTDEARGLGDSIGNVLAQSLVIGASFLVIFTEALILLLDIFKEIKPAATKTIGIFEGISNAIKLAGYELRTVISFIKSNLSYIQWLFRAIGVLPMETLARGAAGGGGTTAGITQAGGGENGSPSIAQRRESASGRVASIMSYDARAQQRANARRENQQVEAGTERPAVVEARGQAQSSNALAEALDRLSGRGRHSERGQVAQIQNTMVVNGERLAEAITRIQERRGLLEGETIQTE